MEGVIDTLRERNGEPIYVRFPQGNSVIYTAIGSPWNPYCKWCKNSLVIHSYDQPFNQWNDCVKGFCNKCRENWPIHKIDINAPMKENINELRQEDTLKDGPEIVGNQQTSYDKWYDDGLHLPYTYQLS